MNPTPYPNNIGQSILVEQEDGSKRYYTVVDEIALVRPESPNRAFCFQRLQYRESEVFQFRVCYYFAAGNEWIFTHSTSYLLYENFRDIVREAVRRGWIEL